MSAGALMAGRRAAFAGLLCLMFAALPGCVTEIVARKIIARPSSMLSKDNGFKELPGDLVDRDLTLRVNSGPDEIELYCWVMKPRTHVVYDVPRSVFVGALNDPTRGGLTDLLPALAQQRGWRGECTARPCGSVGDGSSITYIATPMSGEAAGARPCVGTVLLFQGWGGGVRQSIYLMPLAATLADAGYRVVCVDLRGHGRSGGRHLTYGRLEMTDLEDLIDRLQEAGLAGERVVAIGHSYGAAAAIVAAGDSRVAAAVALSPPASLRAMLPGVRYAVQRLRPQLSFLIGPLVTERVWQRAVTRAGELGGFDPNQFDTTLLIGRTSAPLLLAHGSEDKNCPVSASQRILDARPSNTQLRVFDGDDHWSYLYRQELRTLVAAWLAETLAPEPPQPASSTQPGAPCRCICEP